jgi:hypothetical protein
MEAARDRVIDGKPRKISKLQASVMQLPTKADPASVAKFLGSDAIE